MRVFKRSEGYSPYDLLEYGKAHLKSAQIICKDGDVTLIDQALYMAHLGIECILKSFILSIKSEFTDEHSLGKLMTQLSDIGFSLDKNIIEQINPYSELYKLRYPNPLDPIEAGSEDIDKIFSIEKFLLQNVPFDIKAEKQIYEDSVRDDCSSLKEMENYFISRGGRILMIKEITRKK
jgi:HEPN domain-containing protein